MRNQNLLHQRFLPLSALDYLTRPFAMAGFRKCVYVEQFASDLRPALLVLTLLLGALYFVRSRKSAQSAAASLPRATLADRELVIVSLVVYPLWMAISGNGRYVLPLLLLCGVLWVRAAYLLLPEKAARVWIGLGVALHLFALSGIPNYRNFPPQQWDGSALVDIRVPPRLRDTPYLHLVAGGQTFGAVAAFLHPDGAMTNPIGQYSLPMTGPIGVELQAMLKHWEGRTRLLFMDSWGGDVEARLAIGPHRYAGRFYRLGLEVDWSDCEEIPIYARTPKYRLAPPIFGEDAPKQAVMRLLSCKAIPLRRRDPALEAERDHVEPIFGLLEKQCPRLFSPAGVATERGSDKWQRLYAASDAIVTVSMNDGVFISQFRSIKNDRVGSVEEVLQGKGRISCRRKSPATPDDSGEF